MIAEVAAVLAPVFVLAAIGYGWRLTGAPFDMPFVTRIIMYVAGPCLVFTSLSQLTLPLSQFWGMVGAMIVVTLVVAVVSAVLLRILKLPLRSFVPALTLGNTGNLGLPLCLFAFGEEGLGLAVAIYVTNSLVQFTFVPLLHTRVSLLRTAFGTPMLWGAVAGLTALLADVQLPQWLARTVESIGDLLIPLMLMALGNTVGGLKANNLPRALGLGAARLIISFVAVVSVSFALGLSGVAQGVLVLQGAMPAAVFSYLFAARYERDADDVAGIVLVSTLLGAVTLPLLVSYALWLARS
ncbi:MAG TPA: AEC family transporter [Gammaproteobacteria bacterium]|nr:AEC family transporter [Gammaproteobacteria bacterium]